jgi:predicted phage gp36 major capsid-like protein
MKNLADTIIAAHFNHIAPHRRFGGVARWKMSEKMYSKVQGIVDRNGEPLFDPEHETLMGSQILVVEGDGIKVCLYDLIPRAIKTVG